MAITMLSGQFSTDLKKKIPMERSFHNLNEDTLFAKRRGELEP